MKKLLGQEFEQFINSYHSSSPVSIRYNPKKKTKEFSGFEIIPWCKEGRYLITRPEFVFDPLFHAGTYYVQEASSMIISHAIDFSRDLKILDLCAAPGGKSTLIASQMTGKSLLVSNEAIHSRVKILLENMIKWGNQNVVITNNDSSCFSVLENFFDVVVVDAPCSGEGMFRKDNEAVSQWSEKHVLHCAERQKRILKNILPCINNNGMLLYSTCTFSLEENEQIAEWIFNEFPGQFEAVNLDFPQEWNIAQGHSGNEKVSKSVYRLYPHKVKGEGLFLLCLKKRSPQKENNQRYYSKKNTNNDFLFLKHYLKEDEEVKIIREENKFFALPENIAETILFLKENLRVIQYGIFLGEMKGNDFIPSHDLAMSSLVNPTVPKLELSKEDALKFLRKEQVSATINDKHTWILASHDSVSLGWMKNINGKLKNYYPMDWRIRKNHH